MQDGTPVNVTLLPMFIAGAERFNFSAVVPYFVASVAVRIRYGTPDSVSLTFSGGSPVPAPTSELLSDERFSLDVNDSSANALSILSQPDGNYSVSILRQPPVLQSLEIRVGSGPFGTGDIATATLSPPFQPGVVFNYSVLMPRIRTGVSVLVAFTYGQVELSFEGAGEQLTTDVSSSTMLVQAPDSTFPVTLLLVVSSSDPVYSLSIIFEEADLRSFDVRAEHVQRPGEAGTLLTDQLVWTAWNFGSQTCILVVPFSVAAVAFNLSFSTAGSVTLFINGSGAAAPLTSATWTDSFALSIDAPNAFLFSSTRDGNISCTVTRMPPALTSLALWQQDVDGAVTAIPLSSLTPTFDPPAGVFNYSLTLPLTTAKLAVAAEFCAGMLELRFGALNEPLSSGANSSFLALEFEPIVNTLQLLSSADGVYSLTTTRAAFQPCATAGLCLNEGACVPSPGPATWPWFTCDCSAGWTGLNCSVCNSNVTCPLVIRPIARLSGPSVVDPCDVVVRLDGSASDGFQSAPPTWQWSIVSIVLANGTAVPSPANDTLGATFGRFEVGQPWMLLLDPTEMLDEANYTFALTVGAVPPQNASVQPSTALFSVKTTRAMPIKWTPQLSVLAPPIVVRSSPARIEAVVQRSICDALPADVAFTFAWSVVDVLTVTSVFTSSRPQLLIPANTLQASRSYIVQIDLTASSLLAGSAAGVASIVPQTTVVRASADVLVISQSLVASILYGSRQKKHGCPRHHRRQPEF